MPESVEQRYFVPWGNCVPFGSEQIASETVPPYEAFRTVDNGSSAEALVAAARKACFSCPQLEYCNEQRDGIGDELWRSGVHDAVIGGQVASLGHADNTYLREPPSFRFNLSHMPTEPVQRLGLLRQGIRAGQLTIESRPPRNASIIAHEYTQRFGGNDPELLATYHNTLTSEEQEKAFLYLVLALCQQADFENFSNKVRSTVRGTENRRFAPETHDYNTNYPTARIFVQEAIQIKNLGFTNPGRVAIHYGADYGKWLLDQFGDCAPAKSTFFSIVNSNLKDAARALIAFRARLQAQRTGDAARTDAEAQRRALTNRPARQTTQERNARDKLARKYEPSLGAAAVDRAVTYNPNDPGQALQDREERLRRAEEEFGDPDIPASIRLRSSRAPYNYQERLAQYRENLDTLTAQFGEHPDFNAASLRRFASLYAHPLEAAGQYLNRLNLWREWAQTPEAATYPVPASFLQQYALSGEATCYQDLARECALRRMQARLRKSPNQGAERLSTWAMRRIMHLYPLKEVNDIADTVEAMLNSGLLTTAVAELSELQDPVARLSLDSITDSRTRRYITFPNSLGILASSSRIAFAHHHNLSQLLYGYPISREQVSRLLRTDPDSYFEESVAARFQTFARNNRDDTPLALSALQQDVFALVAANPPKTTRGEQQAHELYELIGVVGGDALRLARLAPQSYNLERALPPNRATWIKHQINIYYPPSEQEHAASDIEAAIKGKRLIINGNYPSEFQARLPELFYALGPDLDDVDRAIVAHVMGVDSLLYHENIGLTLRFRLGLDDVDLATYLSSTIIPQVAGWHNLADAQKLTRSTPFALSLALARDHHTALEIWRANRAYNRRIVAVSGEVIKAIEGMQYAKNVPPDWVSYSELEARAKRQCVRLTPVLRQTAISRQNYCLHRPPDGILDIYYPPSSVDVLWAAIGHRPDGKPQKTHG